MDTSELHRAAEEIRKDYGPDADVDGHPEGDPFMLAVADWLGQMARAILGTSYGELPFEDNALTIARAYLGED